MEKHDPEGEEAAESNFEIAIQSEKPKDEKGLAECCIEIRHTCQAVIDHPLFAIFILLVIIFNSILLASGNYGEWVKLLFIRHNHIFCIIE